MHSTVTERANQVLIPEGTFLYQEAQKVVHLSAFWIDRSPVTVGAFTRFIEAGGYRNRSHWSAAGWAFRTRENITTPRFWGDEAWAPYLVPTHPVVGVSVFEAEAYAAFQGCRLPTEAEWEKAA